MTERENRDNLLTDLLIKWANELWCRCKLKSGLIDLPGEVRQNLLSFCLQICIPVSVIFWQRALVWWDLGEKGGRGGADSWRTEEESAAFRCASSLSASGMKGEQRLSHPRRHFSYVRIWFEWLLSVTKLIIGIGFYSLQLLTDLVKPDSERNSWGEDVNLRKIVWNEGLIPLT